MKFKPALKYYITELIKPLVIFYLIIFAIFCFLTVSISSENVTFGGLEGASMIFLLVNGLDSFKTPFRLYLQNGVSRKTLMQSFLVGMAAVAAFMAAVDVFIALAAKNILPYRSGFDQLYGQGAGAYGAFPRLIWYFTAYIFISLLGFFITTLYYRMNKWQKITLSIGAPVTLIVIIPILDALYAGGAIYRGVRTFFAFAWGYSSGYNPYYSVVTCILFSLLLAALSYLLIRRAEAGE